MIEKKPIYFLNTFGHCGIDWLHSLLDSHNQILIMPALSFYRCWQILNLNSAKNYKKMYASWEKYLTEYVSHNITNEQKKIFNSQSELDNFLKNLKFLLKKNGVSKKEVFLSIHISYAKIRKIDLSKINCIIAHEHMPWYLDSIQNDFPSAKLLFIIRDPRAALAGIWYKREKYFGYLPDYTFNITVDTWFAGLEFLKNNYKKNKINFYVLKNEDLHKNLNKEMQLLSKWLDIKFDQILLKSTFASGKEWYVDSAYIDKKNSYMNSEDNKNFFSSYNIKKRWMSVLSASQIIMIENLFSYIFIKYDYENESKISIRSKIFAHLIFLLPQKKLLNYWKHNYPNLDIFIRVSNKLKKSKNKLNFYIWNLLTNFIKFVLIYLFSIYVRIKMIFFNSNRSKKYDQILDMND